MYRSNMAFPSDVCTSMQHIKAGKRVDGNIGSQVEDKSVFWMVEAQTGLSVHIQ